MAIFGGLVLCFSGSVRNSGPGRVAGWSVPEGEARGPVPDTYITPARPYGAGLPISHVELARRTFVYLEIQASAYNATECGYTPMYFMGFIALKYLQGRNLKFRNQIQPLLPPTGRNQPRYFALAILRKNSKLTTRRLVQFK